MHLYSQVILFLYITLRGTMLCPIPGVHAGALPLMVPLMNGEHNMAAASVIAEMASASNQEVKNAIVDCIDDAGDWHARESPTTSKLPANALHNNVATRKQHTAALLAAEASNQCLSCAFGCMGAPDDYYVFAQHVCSLPYKKLQQLLLCFLQSVCQVFAAQ